MGAPVCNINPANPPPSSRAPALPSIPVASDLPSLIAAVNALRQLVIQQQNPSPGGQNTIGPGGINGNPGATGPAGTPGTPPGPAGSFIEVPSDRQVTTTRIYDPNDPSQQTYIDVDQITGLSFANTLGQTIKWSQGS